ncbi:MAG: hypothetical protein R3290_10610 [Acidimicrobiia bacterium]|nr:hypothetical protein [Acidimicrobiia bacterium]
MSIRVDTGHEPRPSRPGWIWLVVLGIGFLAFLGVAELTGGDTATSTTTLPADALTTTTSGAPVGTLALPSAPDFDRQVARIDGFSGWVVATVGLGDTRLEYTDGDTVGVRNLPPRTEDTMRTDASGTLVAGLGGVDGRSLIVGRTTGDLYAVDLDATSFAWHRDAPGALAWLQEVDDTIRLSTSDVTPGSGTPMNTDAALTEGLEDPVLVGWDFQRYVIETGAHGGTIVTVDRQAREQWRHPGADAALHGDDLVVVRGMSPAGVVFDFLSLRSGEVIDTWFFPDTIQALASDPGLRMLAMTVADVAVGTADDGTGVETTRLILVDTRTMQIARSVGLPYRAWEPTWSHDGRFVLLGGTDDAGSHVVLAYDSVEDTVHTVEFSDWIRRVESVERLARLFENG